MTQDTLKITKTRKVKTPTRGTSVAAGVDFFVPEDIPESVFMEKCAVTSCTPQYTTDADHHVNSVTLKPGESVLIPSGIKMKIPDGYALILFGKSGVGSKKTLDSISCVVDQDYEGEVHLHFVNAGTKEQTISAGDKIIQGVLLPVNYAPVVEVATAEELFAGSNSARGEGGFGSTGTR